MYFDKNGKQLQSGMVIDLGQTVNGQSEFFIKRLDPLDIRYNYDRGRVYEYSQKELLSPSRFTGETEYEILEGK